MSPFGNQCGSDIQANPSCIMGFGDGLPTWSHYDYSLYSGVLCLHSLPSLWLSDICYCVLCHAYNVFVCLDDGSHCEGEKASLAQPLSRVHHMLWVEASSTTLKCGRSPQKTQPHMKSSHKWNEKPISVLFVWHSFGSDSFSSEKRCHPM